MKYIVNAGVVTDKVSNDTVLFCGHVPSPHSDITNGFGYDRKGKTHCYDCCAEGVKKEMIKTGKIALYLSKHKIDNKFIVTDWAGQLEFRVTYSSLGRHNIARSRTDVWFVGPDGHWWWGVSYGNHTQIVHCKRTKELIEAKAA